MTYVCLECNETFDEPAHWEERHGFDYGPFEHFTGCPYCGEPYTKAYRCGECGEIIIGQYAKTTSGHRFCENCYNIMELGEEDE